MKGHIFMKKPKLLIFGVDGAMPSMVLEGIKNNKLPAFKRLIEKSVYLKNLSPVFPTISETCWNSIYTGALPSVHGVYCSMLHKKGEDPWEFLRGNVSENSKAERFWDTLAKHNIKTLCIDSYSSSKPKSKENVVQVLGQYSNDPRQNYYTPSYPSGVSAKTFYINKETLPEKENIYKFVIEEKEIESFCWYIITEEDGIRIGPTIEEAKKCNIIKENCWSDVLVRNLMTCEKESIDFSFRARLDEFNKEDKNYTIYISSCKNLLKEVYPKEFAHKAANIHEVYNCNDGASLLLTRPDKAIDLSYFDLKWKRDLVKQSIETEDFDVIIHYTGFIDAINHYCRSVYEGYSETLFNLTNVRVSDEVRKTVRYVYDKAYKIIDEHLEWLLDNAIDEETTLCVLSDHGSVGCDGTFNAHEILKKYGLTHYLNEDPEKITLLNNDIDWSKTKAYPVGSCYVNINLKGRESTGIVEPEDYDSVVGEIIDILFKEARTFNKNTPALSFAVPSDQAGFIGLSGEDLPDIVYGLSGCDLGGYFGGVHSVQSPSANTKTGGDIRPICFISGPNFKENCALDRPCDLTDIIPTICYGLGYPEPNDATGGVIFKALKQN